MTPPSLKRLRLGLLILAMIFVLAVCGYWLLFDWSLLDSVYMVVITLSTVGYKEVHDLNPLEQVFTVVVIVFGVSTAVYIVGGLLQMMFEGEINRAMGMRRVSREIEHLHDHVVICGFGRMGEVLADDLRRHRTPFVVVENDAERVQEAAARDYLALNDDATEEEALRNAGVDRAKTLVTTLPRDADNVFITLTARNLHPKLMIIARGEYQTTEKKLIQAGADRVVLPAATGAMRMAAMITRPAAMELIEVVAGRQVAEVEVSEMPITPGSPLVGVTLRESHTRARHGLLVVAVRSPEGGLQFNPGGDTVFEAGATVMVLGRPEDIDRFRTEYRL
ncbi:MAG TPA: potassium channel protein [Thermoguttaceae bacterium]|nr:potassium channel protein [Thermoguttaceae bacterium]